MDRDLEEQIDHVARAVTGLVRFRPGRLVALVVAAPGGGSNEDLRIALERRLAEAGIDFVDIQVRRGTGPVHLESAEFER